MKKLLLTLLLGFSALASSAQQYKTLALVMGYRWEFDTRTNTLLSEGKCEDGMEVDFVASRAQYYTPDNEKFVTSCRVADVKKTVINSDKSRTYEFQTIEIASGKRTNCVLVVSEDLRKIRMTMITGDRALTYEVTNMLTDEDF